MLEDDNLKWYNLAVCQGMKLQYFHQDYEDDPVFAQVMDGICMTCPVRKFCLKEGIENNEWGLWGGVFLVAGKMDPAKNAHKTADIWEVIRKGIVE